MPWKKGRGKLGFLAPLIGSWVAVADSPMGRVRCSRTFAQVLNGHYIELRARWDIGPGKTYEEIALIGPTDAGEVGFWSFTSDGKRSTGLVTDVTDIQKDAIGFQAQMPAGIARMAYWPDGEDGFHWAVESKNARGWKRFTEHHYRPEQQEQAK